MFKITQINSETKHSLQLLLFILAIIGVAPFTILAEIFNVHHTIFSVIYRAFFLLIALILLLHTDIKTLLKNKYIQLFLLFFLFYFIRVLFDTLITPKELGFPIIKYYTFTLGVIIIPTLAFTFKLNKEDFEKIFRTILPIFLLICLYSLFYSNYQFENGSLRLWGGRTLHPIGLGHIAVTNIIISFFFFIKEERLTIKTFLFLNVVVSLITLGLTESRGPIIALIVVLLLFILYIAHPKNKIYIPIGLTLIILFVIFLSVFTKFDDRVIFTITKGGTRLEHWRVAITQFIESPIWGSSLEERVRHIYPHNIFIESFMALGILGGILFIIQLVKFLKAGFNTLISYNNTNKWLVLLFTQYFVNAMFSGSLIGNNLFWYLGFLLLYDDKEITHSLTGL